MVISFQTKGSHIEIKMPYFKVRKEFMKIPLPIHAAGPNYIEDFYNISLIYMK